MLTAVSLFLSASTPASSAVTNAAQQNCDAKLTAEPFHFSIGRSSGTGEGTSDSRGACQIGQVGGSLPWPAHGLHGLCPDSSVLHYITITGRSSKFTICPYFPCCLLYTCMYTSMR